MQRSHVHYAAHKIGVAEVLYDGILLNKTRLLSKSK
eukprot:UN02335